MGGFLLEPFVEEVTQRIIDGRYAAGTRLPSESQLQSELKVSRSVVREAMKVLSSRGLVRIEQGRGTFVNDAGGADVAAPLQEQLSLAMRRATAGAGGKTRRGAPRDEFDQLLDVRRVVEVAVAERAAQFATPGELRDMETAVAAMRESPEDVAACAEADLFFHRVLARSTANPLWPAILGGLNDSLRDLLHIGHHGRENALQTAGEHEAIVRAIAAHDSEAAAAAMRAHLESSGKDLLIARRQKKA